MAAEANETANQPQSGSPETVNPYATLLGNEPDLGFDSSEESPEPSEEQEAREGEVAEPEQPVESQEAQAGETEQPTVEDWLKDLTQREAEDYQRRYPTAWKALVSADTPDDMKQLLVDKINTDQEYAQLRALQTEEEEEPTLETAEEVEPQAAAIPQDPAKLREAYYQRINQMVEAVVDPVSQKQLGLDLLKGFGVNVDRLSDPNLSPQDKQELQALVANAPTVGKTLASAAVDLINTVLPLILPEALEMVQPGSSRVYEKQMYAMQWDSVRNEADPRGRFLPQYGSEQFKQATRAAAGQIPGFMEMVFRDPSGRVLPQHDQARMKYSILAKMMTGQKVSPAVVAQAVQTGRKLAGQAERKRNAGRALGAGRPTDRTFGRGATGGGDDDPVMQALDAEIMRTNNDTRPVSRYMPKR
jgi:hypothetical protein